MALILGFLFHSVFLSVLIYANKPNFSNFDVVISLLMIWLHFVFCSCGLLVLTSSNVSCFPFMFSINWTR